MFLRYISTAMRPFSASSHSLLNWSSITTLSGIKLKTKSSTRRTSALLQHCASCETRFLLGASTSSTLTYPEIASLSYPWLPRLLIEPKLKLSFFSAKILWSDSFFTLASSSQTLSSSFSAHTSSLSPGHDSIFPSPSSISNFLLLNSFFSF